MFLKCVVKRLTVFVSAPAPRREGQCARSSMSEFVFIFCLPSRGIASDARHSPVVHITFLALPTADNLFETSTFAA